MRQTLTHTPYTLKHMDATNRRATSFILLTGVARCVFVVLFQPTSHLPHRPTHCTLHTAAPYKQVGQQDTHTRGGVRLFQQPSTRRCNRCGAHGMSGKVDAARILLVRMAVDSSCGVVSTRFIVDAISMELPLPRYMYSRISTEIDRLT